MSRAARDPAKLRARAPSRKVLDADQRRRLDDAAALAHERETVSLVQEVRYRLGLREDAAGVIYGPDGVTPILRPVVRDYTKVVAEGDDAIRLQGEDTLKRAARMRRDGMSSLAIRRALDIEKIVPDGEVFDRALDLGDQLLARDIRAGIEPEESRVVVAYEPLGQDDEGDDESGRITGSRAITGGHS